MTDDHKERMAQASKDFMQLLRDMDNDKNFIIKRKLQPIYALEDIKADDTFIEIGPDPDIKTLNFYGAVAIQGPIESNPGCDNRKELHISSDIAINVFYHGDLCISFFAGKTFSDSDLQDKDGNPRLYRVYDIAEF